MLETQLWSGKPGELLEPVKSSSVPKFLYATFICYVNLHICVCMGIGIYPAGWVSKELVLNFSEVLLCKWFFTIRFWEDVRKLCFKAKSFYSPYQEKLGSGHSLFLGQFKRILFHWKVFLLNRRQEKKLSSVLQESSNWFAEGRKMTFASFTLGHLQEEPKNMQQIKWCGQNTVCFF